MSETLSVADVLRKALEAFGPNGENWVQGAPLCFKEPYCCCATAIEKVDRSFPSKAFRFLREAIGDRGRLAIARWNDAPERTFAEVKALFEKAIEKAGDQ